MASAPLLDCGVARWQWCSSSAAAAAALHVGAAVNRQSATIGVEGGRGAAMVVSESVCLSIELVQ